MNLIEIIIQSFAAIAVLFLFLAAFMGRNIFSANAENSKARRILVFIPAAIIILLLVLTTQSSHLINWHSARVGSEDFQKLKDSVLNVHPDSAIDRHHLKGLEKNLGKLIAGQEQLEKYSGSPNSLADSMRALLIQVKASQFIVDSVARENLRKKMILKRVEAYLNIDGMHPNSDTIRYLFADTLQDFFLLKNVPMSRVEKEYTAQHKRYPEEHLSYYLDKVNYIPMKGGYKVLFPATYYKTKTDSIEILYDVRLNKSNKIYFVRNYYR